MPASQLKQLKASLREHGIVGPQRSKKQKKKGASAGQRIQRDAALTNIRDAFNPFDTKAASRPNKRDVTTPQTMKTAGKSAPQIYGRPGVTKSHGEELRKKSLLLELQRRNKVGGILDRRIGEEDPNMTPEEKAQQRFAREQERKSRKNALFDLEMEEADEEDPLTHGGRAIGFNDGDDFDAGSISGSSDGEEAGGLLKRKREAVEEVLAAAAAAEEEPDRKKTKNEVMKEVMAKSKLYKYERQQAKEDDEDAREQLDKGIGDLRAALYGFQNSLEKRRATAPAPATNGRTDIPNGGINPERAALMESRLDPDKDYDIQIKKLAQDTRARVADRTKTEEEKSTEIAEKQKVLEESRLRRMQGEEDAENNQNNDVLNTDLDGEEYQNGVDDAEAFGLRSRIIERPPGFEDEDEFVIDEDLVANESDFDEEVLDAESVGDSSVDEMLEEDDNIQRPKGSTGANQVAVSSTRVTNCPEIYDDIVSLLEGEQAESAHAIIRRVRLKYDVSLSSSNKPKLEAFSTALVEYLGRRPNMPSSPTLELFEAIIRHLQSMSRTFPDQVGRTFRIHLETMHKDQTMDAGDLMVLTAVGIIYPTSDHFHQVVTPAMTLITRWLSLTRPASLQDFSTGIYLTTLALKYQAFSKRYVPEVVHFITAALQASPPEDVRKALYSNIRTISTLWSHHSAFIEILQPTLISLLQAYKDATKLLNHLTLLLNQSQLQRRPLALHNHRPIPIKSLIPKFEENFNPDRHYDPDRERADGARLRKEYKREKKGAVRELRKDASFLAREKLREKKEKDKAYEEKYRRLVASIQGEEGREAKEYEKEKRKRKGKN
jgi:nucleolar protein 14